MTFSVVMPPATARRKPASNGFSESRSGRRAGSGALPSAPPTPPMWLCVSTRPGITTRPARSRTSAPAGMRDRPPGAERGDLPAGDDEHAVVDRRPPDRQDPRADERHRRRAGAGRGKGRGPGPRVGAAETVPSGEEQEEGGNDEDGGVAGDHGAGHGGSSRAADYPGDRAARLYSAPERGPAMQPFPVDQVRAQFPALARRVGESPAAFFDGPGGSQVPQRVIDAVSAYLLRENANSGGVFATSVETDAMLDVAHVAAADLLGADDPGEVAFGANMTTLTMALARALARTWNPGDEVLVTRADHDANVAPWLLAARDAGAVARHVEIRREDGTLDLDDLARKLSPPHAARGGRMRFQRDRHDPPGREDRRAGPRRGRARLPRRRPPRAARAGRRRGVGLRLPRLLRLQVLRAARRPAVGPARADGDASRPTRSGRPPTRCRPGGRPAP